MSFEFELISFLFSITISSFFISHCIFDSVNILITSAFTLSFKKPTFGPINNYIYLLIYLYLYIKYITK